MRRRCIFVTFPLTSLYSTYTYKVAFDETMLEIVIEETIMESNSIIKTIEMAIEEDRVSCREYDLHERDLWQLLA